MNPLFPRHTLREWTRGLAALGVLTALVGVAWALYLAAVLVGVDVLPHLPGLITAPLRFIAEHFSFGTSDANNLP